MIVVHDFEEDVREELVDPLAFQARVVVPELLDLLVVAVARDVQAVQERGQFLQDHILSLHHQGYVLDSEAHYEERDREGEAADY